MRLLLDTHILIWYIKGDETLPVSWREQIQFSGNQKIVSIATLWEIAIKTNIGKITLDYPINRLVPADFQVLAIDVPHLITYQKLPLHHRDPFDRILLAQAQTGGLTIMTKDPNFSLYDVALLP